MPAQLAKVVQKVCFIEMFEISVYDDFISTCFEEICLANKVNKGVITYT